MLKFKNSEHIVIIEDPFVEAIIKESQWWEERFNENIGDVIIREVVSQMEDSTKYISIRFEVDNATARELMYCPDALSITISKKNVILRNNWKKVRIREGSLYEGLNDNPEFIEELTKEYNTNYDSYTYYLPVSYRAYLVHKEDNIGDFLTLHVDIPFSNIEVY